MTHAIVCRIHELLEDGERSFFTMEYLEGQLLSYLIEALAPKDARLIVRQLAAGLDEAHRIGVIHGDFKPANVIVLPGPTPRAVITDFGLATVIGASADNEGRKFSFRARTYPFMAPEIKAGGAPTVRSDVYAFGKVAEMLVPRERFWQDCVAERPESRPESLAKVLRRLDPLISRRVWMGGIAAGSAAAVAYRIWRPEPSKVYLPDGARILVDGFETAAASPESAARALDLSGRAPTFAPPARDWRSRPASRVRIRGFRLREMCWAKLVASCERRFWWRRN